MLLRRDQQIAFLKSTSFGGCFGVGGGGKCSVYQILQRMQVTKIDGDLASIGWSEQIDVYVRRSAHPYRCASKLTGSCTGSCLAVWHKLIQARV